MGKLNPSGPQGNANELRGHLRPELNYPTQANNRLEWATDRKQNEIISIMATTITRDTLVRALQSMIPEFNSNWISDHNGDLGYPLINDLGRYLCQQAGYGDQEELKRGLDFLESCLENGNSYIRDLVTECLETLSSCEHVIEFAKLFGPKTRATWEELVRSGR